jgi:hypothetical protein
MRLSVGAVNIATGNQIVFDNTKGGAKGTTLSLSWPPWPADLNLSVERAVFPFADAPVIEGPSAADCGADRYFAGIGQRIEPGQTQRAP